MHLRAGDTHTGRGAIRKSPDPELMLVRIYLIKRDRRDSPMGNTASRTQRIIYAFALSLIHKHTHARTPA